MKASLQPDADREIRDRNVLGYRGSFHCGVDILVFVLSILKMNDMMMMMLVLVKVISL